MKYLIMLIVAILIDYMAEAQVSNSLFKTYKNQDLKISALDFYGSLSGNNNYTDFYFNGSGNVIYSQFINNVNKQSDRRYDLQFRYTKNRTIDYQFEPLQSSVTINPNVYHKTRSYTKNSERFLGFGYQLQYYLGVMTRDDYEGSNRKQKELSHNLRISIPLSIGIGRKYPVFSIHKSMWIYSELLSQDLLSRHAGEKEVLQLAELLDENIYTRFFDSRYKNIQDLARIDSVIKEQNILQKQSIHYFTTLYDMYRYSGGASRFRGKTLEFGISGEVMYVYNRVKNIDTFENQYNNSFRSIVPQLFTNYEQFIPINFQWQFNWAIRGEYGFNSLIEQQNNNRYLYDNLANLEAEGSLLFYPDTRNRFELRLLGRYGNKLDFFSNNNLPYFSIDYFNYYLLPNVPSILDVSPNSENSWMAKINVYHYYYINPQFRILTNLGMSYVDNASFVTDNRKVKIEFGVSFSYALF